MVGTLRASTTDHVVNLCTADFGFDPLGELTLEPLAGGHIEPPQLPLRTVPAKLAPPWVLYVACTPIGLARLAEGAVNSNW